MTQFECQFFVHRVDIYFDFRNFRGLPGLFDPRIRRRRM